MIIKRDFQDFRNIFEDFREMMSAEEDKLPQQLLASQENLRIEFYDCTIDAMTLAVERISELEDIKINQASEIQSLQSFLDSAQHEVKSLESEVESLEATIEELSE